MQRRLASATLLFNKEGISLGVGPLLRQRRDESLVSPIPDQREHPERGLPCRYRDSAACGVAQEAAALTEAALALAGHELDAFTRKLMAEMTWGEPSGDQAVEQIIAHFAGSTVEASLAVDPGSPGRRLLVRGRRKNSSAASPRPASRSENSRVPSELGERQPTLSIAALRSQLITQRVPSMNHADAIDRLRALREEVATRPPSTSSLKRLA